jgi:hypothetical protein
VPTPTVPQHNPEAVRTWLKAIKSGLYTKRDTELVADIDPTDLRCCSLGVVYKAGLMPTTPFKNTADLNTDGYTNIRYYLDITSDTLCSIMLYSDNTARTFEDVVAFCRKLFNVQQGDLV